MKFLRKMFSTLTTSLFIVVFLLFITVLTAAACSHRVTMSFETFGGTKIASICVDAGKEITVPNNPEKEGYVFLGWYLDSDCLGDAQDLPAVMPETSVTYYAKYAQYPKLNLLVDGGALEKTRYYVEAGTNLSAFLSDVKPQKDGLLFDGWEKDGVPLSDDAVMTEEDLTLSARYLATYSVEIRLQNADGTGFDVEKTIYAERVGERVRVTPPEEAHFTFDDSQSSPQERVLQAGENQFYFTYLRESRTAHYFANVPQGDAEGETTDTDTYYRGEFSLPECGFSASGYVFLGWAESPSATEFYPSGARYVMGEEDADLYAVWASAYGDGRGGSGNLLLACNRYDDGTTLALLQQNSGTVRGSYDEADNLLAVAGTTGRIEHGAYLLSDSGTYTGYSLASGLSHARYGVLTLDFERATALYAVDGEEYEGDYSYLYDESEEAFIGRYEFSAQGTQFLFTLQAGAGTFLRQGEEAGEYQAAFDKAFGRGLSLDGFGTASFVSDGEVYFGSYLGTGEENEWTVRFPDTEQKVLLKNEVSSINGTAFRTKRVYLVFQADRFGTFSGENGETLALDGYGVSAVYTTANGVERGTFSGEKRLVTMGALRFVLTGDRFRVVGSEAGYYSGENGQLFLDGAGGASFLSTQTTGTYRALDTGDWLATGKGESFRFQIFDDRYRVFDESVYGVYLMMGGGLNLDGYGGGSYMTVANGSIPVRVEAVEDRFEVYSDSFRTLTGSLTFRVNRTERTLSEITAREVGTYRLTGTDEASVMRLDGAGGATILDERGAVVATGTYSYESENDRGAFVLALNEEFPLYYFRFRLSDRACSVYRELLAGSYTGDCGSLVLDGYGGGVMQWNGETVVGSIRSEENDFVLTSGNTAYFIRVSGREIASAARYSVYRSNDGKTLYAGENSALFDGKECGWNSLGGGEFCLTVDGASVFVLLDGTSFFVFDEKLAGTYRSETGEVLVLDGYGRGTFAADATVVSLREGNYLQLNAGGKIVSVLISGNSFAVGEVQTDLL